MLSCPEHPVRTQQLIESRLATNNGFVGSPQRANTRCSLHEPPGFGRVFGAGGGGGAWSRWRRHLRSILFSPSRRRSGCSVSAPLSSPPRTETPIGDQPPAPFQPRFHHLPPHNVFYRLRARRDGSRSVTS